MFTIKLTGQMTGKKNFNQKQVIRIQRGIQKSNDNVTPHLNMNAKITASVIPFDERTEKPSRNKSTPCCL